MKLDKNIRIENIPIVKVRQFLKLFVQKGNPILDGVTMYEKEHYIDQIKSFLKYSNEIFRQAYLNNIGLQQYVKFKSSFEFNFEAFSKYVNDKNIEKISGLFEESHYHIKRWANNKMVMTNLAFDLTKLIHV